MSKVFDLYSKYYEDLYEDKDYQKEVEFVISSVELNGKTLGDILELGCGTGKHAKILASRGYKVHGIDRSKRMIDLAKEKIMHLPHKLQGNLSFELGDATNFKTNKKFDIVLALFHVISYQTSNRALNMLFETAFEALKPGGIFLFDYWYGPAVLTEKPSVRHKRKENKFVVIDRIATPKLLAQKNVVDVNYKILIKDKSTSSLEEINEVHSMRYFFLNEIELFAEKYDFKIVCNNQWLTNKSPSINSWCSYTILSK